MDVGAGFSRPIDAGREREHHEDVYRMQRDARGVKEHGRGAQQRRHHGEIDVDDRPVEVAQAVEGHELRGMKRPRSHQPLEIVVEERRRKRVVVDNDDRQDERRGGGSCSHETD